MNTQARFYTWQAPGKPVVVHLSLNVVDRIAEEALRGLGALPRRGAEVGGVLLGTAQAGDRLVVKVVDAVPVICGHYFGPSYVLTQEEKATLQQVLARWRPSPSRNVSAVGYYRSHTRDELFLSDDDVWLMSTYFADPTRVALVVRPRVTAPSMGGFFFWEGDRIHATSCYAEFPFDPLTLAAAEPAPAVEAPAAPPAAPAAAVPEAPEPPAPPAAEAAVPEEPAAAPAPAAAAGPAAPEESPQPAPPAPVPEHELPTVPSFLRSLPPRKETCPRPKPDIPWLAIPICLLLVLLGGWLGTQGAQLLGLGTPRQADTDAYALRLTVTEYGDNLHLTWNRSAPALREAERGILIIADGEQSRTLELDPTQLRGGSVIYRRANGPVRFRLELDLKGNRSLSEAWEPPAGKPPAQ